MYLVGKISIKCDQYMCTLLYVCMITTALFYKTVWNSKQIWLSVMDMCDELSPVRAVD